MGMINKYECKHKPKSADHKDYARIPDMPEESIGKCRNFNKCFQNNVELANGLCVRCWDKWVSTASTGQRSDMSGIKSPKGANLPKKQRGPSVTKSTYGRNGNGPRLHPYDK